jgi:hypothetical protein
MIAAGIAVLVSEFPEEVLSWRTPSLRTVTCRVYAAMEVARAKADGRGRITLCVPPELALTDE